MEKIDKRINYRMVLDTETCPLDKELNKVVPSNMLVYDIGWAIVDKRGNVYKTESFVNADVYLGEKDLMKSAYYANKLPQYEKEIKNGQRKLASLYNIKKAFMADIEKYGITEFYAHNMRFDYGSLNNTQRWVTKSKLRYWFPKNAIICDTLRMARDVVAKTPSYIRFCKMNGFVTARGQVQMKAETLYRFISGNIDFIESHTGLEDVLIEKEIMAYCFAKHKKMNRLCFSN